METQSDINSRFKKKLNTLLGSKVYSDTNSTYQQFESTEYKKFTPGTFIEKYCDIAGRALPFIKPSKKKEEEYWEQIIIGAMRTTPQAIYAAIFFTVGLGLFAGIPFLILGANNFCFFVWCTSFFVAYIIMTYPEYQAQITKIKVQQEALLALLYMTIYLKVNPVLENALYFASQHLNGPFGRDLKQLLW